MHRRFLAALVTGAALAAGALGAGGQAAAASSSGTSGQIPHITTFTPRLDAKLAAPPDAAKVASTSARGLKVWSRTVADGASSFTYRMVGKSPFVAATTASTTVRTPLVPLVVRFSDGTTWDPTVGDSCDPTSAVTRTLKSPMVKPLAWSFGGTPVGTGQYSDVFQRASFYPQTKASGVSPGYHVKLRYLLQPAITVTVPNASAAYGTMGCGNGKFAGVDISFLDSFIQNTALPQVAAAGFGPTSFPLFILGNVVEYQGSPSSGCCILGYHNATSTASTGQTYGVSMYDNTGVFSGSGDVSVLSHEVSEWVNDPFTVNPTKPWGNIGQVSGCQNNLEVGDPLSGSTLPVTFKGKTYHLQEMAFVSWFYHESPSTGVNGWYSNLGSFLTPAAACP